MKLYDAPWAPSPRKVRIYLAEKGLEVEREVLEIRRGENLGDAYLAVNPRGVLPALLLDNGALIDESNAICRYFEVLHPKPPLFGSTPEEIALIEARARRIEQEGYAACVYAFRNGHPAFAGRALNGKWPPAPQIPALVERAHLLWGVFLDAMEQWLTAGEWVSGARYGFADIAALVTIDFAGVGKLPPPGEAQPNIRRWHAAASARPSAAA